MARRDQEAFPVFEDVNLLLFNAYEHGARHVALQRVDDGTEIRFLGPDGSEHVEQLSLPYEHTVRHLRKLSVRSGRVHVDMGGHQWSLELVVPGCRCPDQVFLHMRPVE